MGVALLAAAGTGLASEGHPTLRSKVDRLSHIEASVEARMVPTGKGEHKFACTLNTAIDRNAGPFYAAGRDCYTLVPQELAATSCFLRKHSCSERLETVGVGRGDAVPAPFQTNQSQDDQDV